MADLYLAAAAGITVRSTGRKTVDASIIYSDHSPFWDNRLPGPPGHRGRSPDQSLLPPDDRHAGQAPVRASSRAATRASLGLLAELAQPHQGGLPANAHRPDGPLGASTARCSTR
ncbi:MAG: hypothetical protein MZV64_22830 [Ignavibacteriales bacterium]|nr:hypothetical protein [Ignavibacteriales bacterium]